MPITFEIIAGEDANSSKIIASGEDQSIATDKELIKFGVHQSALKDALAIALGKRPDNVYTRRPTPSGWEDYYLTEALEEVTRVLEVESAKITEISSQPEIVSDFELTNPSSFKGEFIGQITHNKTHTLSSSRSNGGELEVGQKLTYKVEALGSGVGGETSVRFAANWSKETVTTDSINLGTLGRVQVTLEPGQSVIAQLSASAGTIKARVRYKAFLKGDTLVHYDQQYNGHYFWFRNIQIPMYVANIENSIEVVEDIEIGYYSRFVVRLIDKKSGDLMQAIDMTDIPANSFFNDTSSPIDKSPVID